VIIVHITKWADILTKNILTHGYYTGGILYCEVATFAICLENESKCINASE
jgi:hypothetical protein